MKNVNLSIVILFFCQYSLAEVTNFTAPVNPSKNQFYAESEEPLPDPQPIEESYEKFVKLRNKRSIQSVTNSHCQVMLNSIRNQETQKVHEQAKLEQCRLRNRARPNNCLSLVNSVRDIEGTKILETNAYQNCLDEAI